MPDYENNATISYREDINPELCIIRVKPDEGQVPEFEPGQYAELALPELDASKQKGADKVRMIRRSYSIGSSPEQRSYLEFYLVIVPEGYLTPDLFKMQVGDRLWLGPKIKGKFTLEPVPADKDIVMISTGTGLAPFVSMLQKYHGSGRWRRCVIVHGARKAIDLGYRDYLTKMAQDNSDVFYIPSVTREPEDSPWTGHRGRVQSIFENGSYEAAVGAEFNPQDCHVMLCGNPQMIDSMQELLEARGFRLHKKKEPGNIHIERYW